MLQPIGSRLASLMENAKAKRAEAGTTRKTFGGAKEMATVTVTKVGKSRSNKDVVYFDNKHDFQDAYYIGNKCPSIPQVGQLIEPSASSSEFRGNTYWYLNSWKGVGTSPARPVDTPQGSDQSAPREPLKGWDIQSGDLSRYVSNVVGSAIAAGLIKTPLQLLEWS